MRALVVFETSYGNTRQVAEMIREGLGETMDVDVRSADDTRPIVLADYQLVVVGGPTHALGMSTPESRAQAQNRKPVDADSTGGLRDWLSRLGPEYAGAVAAFDTRSGRHRTWPGSASRAVAKELRRVGIRLLDRRSFLVSTAKGPLRDGELYQARLWATGLAVQLRSSAKPAGTPARHRRS